MPTLFRGNESGAGGEVAGDGERARSPVSCVLADPGEEPLVSMGEVGLLGTGE